MLSLFWLLGTSVNVATQFISSSSSAQWRHELIDAVPVWTVEPDISVVKAIAQPYPPPGIDHTASTFSQGAFNKLFLCPTTATSFIFRVSLPVDPYFKTVNEVTTLQYISDHTTIPIPRVVAYDGSANNELGVGFEWILMTRMPGIPLKDLWSTSALSWEERVHVIDELSEYIKQT